MSRGEAIVYDCSGAPRYREVWDYFCGEVAGVIYVIDSADRVRLSTVKANIADFLKHPLLRRKPIVFLANKQDLQDALPKEELKRLCALDKKHISNPFSLKAAVAVNGMGFNDAMTFIETNTSR
jgi:signal recognition particle receptor subunit beta